MNYTNSLQYFLEDSNKRKASRVIYESSITLTQNQTTTLQENYKPVSFMNITEKNLQKNLAN